ncbi:DUF2235 domain-containing protein [Flavisphingomonas formosensis]|uniref:DUF2235 domain-containing protein n=1 Tax=Flavisphingomonas formosensis TaxID=861534 RepID=UPI0012F76B09|nr:DUF2235 domain-containing protein [Sphingomonas formosensis]
MGTANDSKAIILFSDGTGNSSAKLFKTNVWRLYEAIDLGPAPGGGGREQIAYYSNGVGTSGFRPLALLGGIFGYGLKANILDLYKYLCRNYRDGDTIHVFGFSRGSFTVRLLVGLIVSQGILRGDSPDVGPDEDKLAYLARAAYRAFAREAWPNRWLAKQVARMTRRVRDGILDLHRRATGRDRYDPAHNVMTDVAFVGVWDTVAAYGGPIVEITRGIDDWIWPLTMPNYQLSPRVLQARHALSLDDERDSFQPLLWDEVREDMLVRQGGFVKEIIEGHVVETVRKVPRGRLKQVWFAGMHADVGGGYPDESLSYVSLLWMIQELDGSLRMIGPLVERVRSMANIFGPIHDSRAGLGAYYRYQPRRIAAMLEGPQDNPAFVATRALRDPAIADAGYVMPGGGDPSTASGVDHDPHLAQLARRIRSDHGLLCEVRIHESVLARIAEGTDGYAPIGLPPRVRRGIRRRAARRRIRGTASTLAGRGVSRQDMHGQRNVEAYRLPRRRRCCGCMARTPGRDLGHGVEAPNTLLPHRRFLGLVGRHPAMGPLLHWRG